jgi:hypothetical protein
MPEPAREGTPRKLSGQQAQELWGHGYEVAALSSSPEQTEPTDEFTAKFENCIAVSPPASPEPDAEAERIRLNEDAMGAYRLHLEQHGHPRREADVWLLAYIAGRNSSEGVSATAGPTASATVIGEIGTSHIAYCPEHGLHGERDTCFACGGPVLQIPMRAIVSDSAVREIAEFAATNFRASEWEEWTSELQRKARAALSASPSPAAPSEGER